MRLHQIILFLIAVCNNVYAQKPLQVTVAAGASLRKQTPVTLKLNTALDTKLFYYLEHPQSKKKYPAQLSDSVTVVFILPEEMKANTQRSYLLKSSNQPIISNSVTVTEKPGGILVSSNGKPVLYYHTAVAKPAAGAPDYYKRSGFIHPLYAPGGQILTDDFPVGHTHQHGMFNAWVNTSFRNEKTDFWNQQKETGTVMHAAVKKISEGPVVTQIELLLQHKSLKYGTILEEKWTLSFYPFSDYFLFDLQSDETNVTDDTLKMDNYHYGGMALRGSRAWNDKDKANFLGRWNLVTAADLKDSAANHTAARWVDISGNTGGSVAGVTVFDHPKNLHYPQPVRVHEAMPYWCFSPSTKAAFTIDPGKTLSFRYRYFVHEKTASAVDLQRLEQDWIRPVQVTVKVRP